MKKKLLVTGILVSCYLTLVLSGCNNKEVDYGLDSEGKMNQETSPLKLKEDENWMEEFSVTGEMGTATISISSSVMIPDVEQMSVVEVQEQAINEAYEKQLIQKLYGDVAISSLQEDYSAESSVHRGAYIGEYNSYPYILETEEGWTGGVSFRIEDIYQVCPEELKECKETSYILGDGQGGIPGEENTCSISEEEAKQKGEEMLRSLGWTEFVWKECTPLEWMGIEGNDVRNIQNGYYMKAVLGIDGVDFGKFSNSYESVGQNDIREKEQVTICINDYGIIGVGIQNPVNIVKITKLVTLLPLDTIKGILLKEINENPDKYLSLEDKTWFTELELNYIKVKDDSREDYYSYVPAWRMACIRGEEQSVKGYPVIVNAMDGTIIHKEDVIEE